MKEKRQQLVIYTDGGSRGNPGPAALGVVFADAGGKVLKEYGKALGRRTNNEAEYEAALFALQKARALFGREKIAEMQVEMRMDSELVARQLSGEYKIEEERLWPIFMKIWNTRMDFPHITFSHIPREENRRADAMVNQALDHEQGLLLAGE